jgi:molecular chaperone DnaK
VSVHIVQGEESFAPDNKTLGRFELTGIRPAPRGVPKIGVTFSIDGDGIVQVSAKDEDTGEQHSIEIVAGSGLSETEIDELLRETATNREQKDRIASEEKATGTTGGLSQEFVDSREELRKAIYIYQWRLDTEGQNFKGAGRATMERCLDEARKALAEARTADELKSSISALSMVSAIFEKFLESN